MADDLYSPEDAVQHIMRTYGGSRGDALNLLKKARDTKDPFTDHILGIDEFLEKQFRGPLFAERFASGVVKTAGIPIALGVAVGERSLEPLRQLSRVGENIPPGIKLPLVGDIATALGETAGSMVPFGLAEKITAPVAMKVAAMASRVPGAALRTAAEGGAIEEVMALAGKGGIGRLARAKSIQTAADFAMQGGIIGALQDPDHPVKSGLIGAGFGGAIGAVTNVFAKPLQEFKGNKQVGQAIQFLSGVYHERPEVTAARYKNFAELQADLIKNRGNPIDPMHLYTAQDAGFLQTHQVPPENLKESPSALYRARPLPKEGPGVFPPPRGYKPGLYGPEPPPLWWDRGRVQKTASGGEDTFIETQGGLKFVRKKGVSPEAAAPPPEVSKATMEKRRKVWEEAESALNRKEARAAEIAAEQDIPRAARSRDPFNLKKTESRLDDLVKVRVIPSEIEQQAAVQAEKATRGVFEAGQAIRKGEPPPPTAEKTQWGKISPTTDLLNRAAETVRGSLEQLPGELEALGKSRNKSKFSFRKALFDDRGAILPKSRKESASLSPDDMEAIFKEWGIGAKDVIHGGHVDPAATFNDPASKALIYETHRAPAFAKYRPPAATFSKDPAAAKWYRQYLDDETHFVSQVQRNRGKAMVKWGEKFGVEDVDIEKASPEQIAWQEEIHKANQGLETVVSMDPDGKWKVRLEQKNDVSPRANEAARAWRNIVPEHLYEMASGYKVEAQAIVKAMGFGPDRTGSFGRLMKKLQGIQDGSWTGKTKALEREAAEATRGMIHITDHDLSIQPYDEGVWALLPIPGERRRIQEEIASLQEQISLGVSDSRGSMQDDVRRLKEQEMRLAELDKNLSGKGKSQFAGQNVIPGRQWYSPINQMRDPHAAPYQVDPSFFRLSGRLISNMTVKRLYDRTLQSAKTALQNIQDDGSIQRYLVDFLQNQRGLKAYHDDQWIRNLAANFEKFGLHIGEREIRNYTANWMKFQVLTRLFASPRFGFFVNPTQTFQTMWPMVSTKSFFRAYGRTWSDFWEFVEMPKTPPKTFAEALRRRNNVWVRALAEGTLEEGSERFIREARGLGKDNWMDHLMNNKYFITARGASLSESWNRVHSQTAGEFDFMEPGFKVPAAVKKFFPEELIGTPTLKQARRYGKALKETSQFILQKKGKPIGHIV